MYTRIFIESAPADERPTVRCRHDCDLVDQDGICTTTTRTTTGRIVIDGNNPWVEIWAGGKCIAERFSWGLVLEVLNNRFSPPIHFSARVEYEV